MTKTVIYLLADCEFESQGRHWRELYFVIIRSPNYCSDSVPPGPRSRKRLFKARLQRKKPCACDYFLPSLFRSALQDPDVLLVPHRFVFHMEREAIINMEQVSESGPQQPVVQPLVAPVITTISFTEISNSIPSVATARPSLIDTCRPSGLSFSQPSQPSFGLGFPQPSSSQHGFGLGFSQPGGSLDSSSMQLGLGMMPPMMSIWVHQLQSQLQTQIETTIQRALAEKLPHTPANSVFEPVRPGGSSHCVFHHTVIRQEGKELILVRGPILRILKVKKQVLTLRVRTGIIALNE